MITKEEAIKFAIWLRDEDTIEIADKWFGYSDEDMFDYFCSNFLPAENKIEDEIEYCNKYKWGDCECKGDCRRGLTK